MNLFLKTDFPLRIISVALFCLAVLFIWMPAVFGDFGKAAQTISIAYTLFIGVFREMAIRWTLESLLWGVNKAVAAKQ